jgi:hypothetical protein
VKELLLKVGNKLAVSIRGHRVWHAMQFVDIVEKEAGSIWCIGIISCRDEVSHFRESVNNYHNGSVVLSSFREFGEKINGDLFLTLFENGNR